MRMIVGVVRMGEPSVDRKLVVINVMRMPVLACRINMVLGRKFDRRRHGRGMRDTAYTMGIQLPHDREDAAGYKRQQQHKVPKHRTPVAKRLRGKRGHAGRFCGRLCVILTFPHTPQNRQSRPANVMFIAFSCPGAPPPGYDHVRSRLDVRHLRVPS